jgi:hypothetical protein
VADKPTHLVLAALGRAAAEPAGLPLFASKSVAGLFAATAAGRQAAQRCQDEDYLRLLRSETKGKTPLDYYVLTEKGLAHLLSQSSPRHLLEDLVRVLEARQAQASELLAAARQMQTTLDGLKANAEQVLRQLPPAANGTAAAPPNEGWKEAALAFLERWQVSGSSEDCPLPELFRQARQTAPSLSLGCFHDGLRQLHDGEQIYLHPWTGPLYAIPEPPLALLVGHEIAYYASPRLKLSA